MLLYLPLVPYDRQSPERLMPASQRTHPRTGSEQMTSSERRSACGVPPKWEVLQSGETGQEQVVGPSSVPALSPEASPAPASPQLSAPSSASTVVAQHQQSSSGSRKRPSIRCDCSQELVKLEKE
ncbi:hypothetical protein DPX16_21435 [Anabarilius grahami]|uniref:Uncharacterized protein n=1 Tax=Anabarilius grahami TaxID=495550 RepID=A0A3N0XUF1_ANAGA|nr:hypothetical protein DPX16_21435 [Anabarilius grahami]